MGRSLFEIFKRKSAPCLVCSMFARASVIQKYKEMVEDPARIKRERERDRERERERGTSRHN